MNREIKFRVWDVDSSEMLTDFENPHNDYSLDFNNGNMCLLGHIEDNYPQKREAHIMQYAGFKDKNEKEIYSGDIGKDEHGQLFKIEFEDGCFMAKASEGRCPLYMIINVKTIIEIIGNIYENPELLNKK